MSTNFAISYINILLHRLYEKMRTGAPMYCMLLEDIDTDKLWNSLQSRADFWLQNPSAELISILQKQKFKKKTPDKRHISDFGPWQMSNKLLEETIWASRNNYR